MAARRIRSVSLAQQQRQHGSAFPLTLQIRPVTLRVRCLEGIREIQTWQEIGKPFLLRGQLGQAKQRSSELKMLNGRFVKLLQLAQLSTAEISRFLRKAPTGIGSMSVRKVTLILAYYALTRTSPTTQMIMSKRYWKSQKFQQHIHTQRLRMS